MPEMKASQLASVNSFPKLIDLLREQLEWPIGEDYGIEDVTFEYEPHELGLKPEETAKIREIHQLRPLVTGQPWGVFFLSFEEKTISVTVLRRMLKALVVKKRAGAQSADRQAWNKEDLIFAANFGKSGERELAFVHFSDAASTGDLPVMKVLGWNAKDTKLHNRYVASQLQSRLTWPDDPADQNRWRGQWAGAFETGLNEVIRTSKDLAIRLAGLAGDIRARANQLLEVEDESGPMRTMLAAFRKNLIQDLDEDGFADMFAQTICYGMLAAKISRPGADLIADNLADTVPRTNPFLKELFANFLKLGGRDKRSGLDFDELGVRDVVDMLNRAKMDAVLRDFGDRNPKEDPVIHFYELFLKEYDPEKRMQRGVFYTPRPVVNFIVRGVDEMLQTEFGLPLGLADMTTWGELAERNETITIPDHIDPADPFVQVLDPATGTGTFLVETIDVIYKRMVDYWRAEGKDLTSIKAEWNDYVPKHLLPRLTGFELMMAPYSIAHMKIGLKLVETGYQFKSNERARVFLTNALEPARDLDMELAFMSEALAREAGAANEAKKKTPFTAVIGNPPYSIKSFNMGNWIIKLCATYKENVRKEESQIQSLSNDYIKFIRLGHTAIEKSGLGVFGMITGHGYMLGTQPRDLRKSLFQTFHNITAINLNGSVRRDNVEGVDEPVFEIMTGVGIGLFSRLPSSEQHSARYLSIEGALDTKMNWLLKSKSGQLGSFDTTAKSPNFHFWKAGRLESEYHSFSDIPSMFGTGNRHKDKEIYWSTGFTSQQDQLAIAFSEADFTERMADLATSVSKKEFRKKYRTCTTNQWEYEAAKKYAGGPEWKAKVRLINYRPFDKRYTILDKRILTILRGRVQSLLDSNNVAITVSRAINDLTFAHSLVVDGRVDRTSLSSKTSTNAYVFPLWLEHDTSVGRYQENISRNSSFGYATATGLLSLQKNGSKVQTSLGAEYRHSPAKQASLLAEAWDGRGDLERNFGPRDIFDWVYAVLHTPSYRERYAEFLKSDFPRIPLPSSRAIFADLVPCGRKLAALHLLKIDEAPVLVKPAITFHGTGEVRVAKGYPKYKNGKVLINPTHWFEDVVRETWDFHIGGYQVCHKWLKDRAGKGGKHPSGGRILTEEDILHYRRTVTALTETRRIMAEIDQIIEDHGGWPDAFKVGDSEV